ncbi:MAG: hypothetical protein J3Q66DRAFT_349747 [Benniella sp.]|nr:MAG: hypothetical protein J3Q66DRAFT_349747 [Benniella sp.]
MRLMTCSECESMRLIVLVLLHRCASTSNRDPSQQSGSNALVEDTGSKEHLKSKECSGLPANGSSWMSMRTVDSHQSRNKTEPSTYIQT